MRLIMTTTRIKWVECILLFVWQMPQNLIGAILWRIWKDRRMGDYEGMACTRSPKFISGLSLGRFIFVHYTGLLPDGNAMRMVRHEYGHCRQSMYLGPFYLLAVGIPSVIFWINDSLKKDWSKYYTRYPENWADKLGGVKR